MKAVLLVGAGNYRYRTSVLQRVRLALNSMILTDRYRMRPCHGKVATRASYSEGLQQKHQRGKVNNKRSVAL